MRLTGTCVLVLSVFVFAGPALADNGHGNGGGNANTVDPAPGHSADAPGQAKKEDPPAAEPVTTTTSDLTTPTATVTAPTVGVKPSNETAHETHAPASSATTKQYGNGRTAGSIALEHGATPTTRLHGPGNSQPHKAARCGGGHEVDVHAVKGQNATCGSATPVPTPTPTAPSAPPTPRDPPLSQRTAVDPGVDPGVTHVAEPVVKTRQAPRQALRARAAEGALGSTERTARSASLPFTGLRVSLVFLIGLLLLGTGLALRSIRTVEATVESGHDHTTRTRRAGRGSRLSVRGRTGR